ncbi:MAG: DUF4249 family protein [Bacteroidales bacterium]|nr:DUF4249 family protein [Bacteroidales bacterium]
MKSPCLLPCLLLLFAVVSCVYDFHPDWQGQAGFVAIEGDILVGDTCQFEVRFSTDLEDENNVGEPLTYTLRVEADDGTVYLLQDSIVDLTMASLTQEYRLVVEVQSPFRRTYASAWAPVLVSPPIDSLSYAINAERTALDINVSTHSDAPVGYYRWSASETWEYHSTYYAEYFFAPAGTVYRGRVIEQNSLVAYEEGDNVYYCWDSGNRSDILLGSTVELTEDRLVDHCLYSFSNTDRKVSVVYFVELSQIRLTEEAYRFWETVRNNSSNVGGLFSPEPSELRGNIVNVDDPDELVLGYVSVSTCTRKKIFVNNYDTRFSRWEGSSYNIVEPFPDIPDEWRKYYGWRYRFGWIEEKEGGSNTVWAPIECIDCRASGGTKERPWWWINNDK